MALAVVIPTLNEEETIGGCLDSVGEIDGFEVIVVDGGSEDRTCEMARRVGAKVVTGPPGRGPQLNLGAESTDAHRLLFLHADCRLPNGWRSAVDGALDDERVSLACFRLRTISSATSEPSLVRRWWLKVFDLRSHGLGLPYGDQAYAVRREVFDRIGRFPDIPLMEDVVFARSCLRQGKLKRLPLEVWTTARRAEQRPFRTSLIFTIFPTLHRLGVAPETLARWYGNVR